MKKAIKTEMTEVPIDTDLYEFLEMAGAKQGLTASEYAQKLVLENLDLLKELAKEIIAKPKP